jgi:alkylhydroperoxidase family enzyme
MQFRLSTTLVAGALLAPAGWARAEDPSTSPRPIPLTRAEMKKFLEDMKERKPRIPLPPLTEEEKAKLGERGTGYEARLRALYLGGNDGRGGGFSRDQEPNMTLERPFKTMLFWVVCRTNNCQYCQGHQEWGLAGAGMKEDEIAALDGDWSEFTPAQQAALAFARKVTYEPHKLADADVDALRKHYKDLQILEMLLSVGGNNSINRWKEGVGVPQSKGRGNRPDEKPSAEPRPAVYSDFRTPTSDAIKDRVTRVAPLVIDEKTGKPTSQTVFRRAPLEPRAEAEKALEAARKRTPRLPLVDEARAREVLGEDGPKGALPQWVRLLANFPRSGKACIVALHNDEVKGDLTPLLKAQVSWIIARQDRAWYALAEARTRLRNLGQTDEQIFRLDGTWEGYTPAEQSLFTLARKLAASPVVLTDADVAEAVKRAGNRDVVQLVNYVGDRAMFDRLTEAAGLTAEK